MGVTYTIDAKVAGAIRNLQELGKAEQKLAQQTAEVGKAATAEGYAVEQAMKRMGQAAEGAALKFQAAKGKIKGYGVGPGAPVGGTTYAAGLAARPFVAGTDQALRVARSADESFSRFLQAAKIRKDRQNLRDDASFGRFLQAESLRGQRLQAKRTMYFGADPHLAGAAAVAADIRKTKNASLLNAGMLDAAASGVNVFGTGDKDRFDRRARRQVAGNLLKLGPGIAGSITGDNLDKMVEQRADQLRASSQRFRRGMLVAGGAAIAGVGIAVEWMNNMEERARRVGEAGIELRHDLRPLLSLGNNASNAGKIKREVLAQSSSLGLSTAEIGQARFNLQSGSANLSGKTRDQIFSGASMLTRTAGGDLDTNVTALTKAYQVYGKESGNVERINAKLFKTMQEGFVTMQDLSELMPDVLPAAKAMGITFDEVAGSIITATQVGGRNEKTFTGLRNVYVKMADAQKQGIQLTGTFAEKIEQLSKIDPNMLTEIFGERAIGVIAALTQNTKELKTNIEGVANVDSKAVQKKLMEIFQQPGEYASQMLEVLKKLNENREKGKSLDPGANQKALKNELINTGMEEGLPEFVKGAPDLIKDTVKWAIKYNPFDLAGAGANSAEKLGRERMLKDLGAAAQGGDVGAKIQFGAAQVDTLLGSEASASYLKMSSLTGGAPLNVNEFGKYWGLSHSGDKSEAAQAGQMVATWKAMYEAAEKQAKAADLQQKANQAARLRNAQTQ